MMRSLFSGVSGIKVHQTRMDVIGNNIANINTIGFKGSRTTFSDMLSQMQKNSSAPTETRGGINPRQIGLGVNVESIDLLFNDASPQQTGKNTDLALSGNALFYLKNGEQSYYTRNGAFEFDEDGYYGLPGSGLRVQGWNASPEGNLDTNGLSTDIIVPVGKTMEAAETTKIDYSGNLDKESRVIERISYTAGIGEEVDPTLVVTEGEDGTSSVNVDGVNVVAATITFKDGSTMSVTSGYYEVGKTVPITTLATIYDSLGGKHEVTVLIDKDPTTTDEGLTDPKAIATGKEDEEGNTVFDNRWRVYIAPGVGKHGPAGDDFENSYERIEADGSKTKGTMNALNFIYFDDRGQFVSNGREDAASITFEYSDGNGARSNQAIIDFAGLTQYASRTTSFPTTNGNSAGVLQSLAIDGNGIITGTYTNGLRRNEAQIAVAQFTNPAGLTKAGSTIYQESNNSGTANIKTMEDFGVSVIASALEMSNVDLATEFADMIITQRGFQANSKITTVSDEMLETLVNMKR